MEDQLQSDADAFVFKNPDAEQNGEDLITWQTFDYDDETESGAATVFYNFENDEN